MDGYHFQCRDIASFMEGIELALCVVAEELEIRVVHVAGWAGWINRRETVVEAEWEAYVGNVATGSRARSRMSRGSKHHDENKN